MTSNSSAASRIKTPTISDDFLHNIMEEMSYNENYMDKGWCSSTLLGRMLASNNQTPLLIFLSMARRLSSDQTPPPVREIATSSSASGSPGKENRN